MKEYNPSEMTTTEIQAALLDEKNNRMAEHLSCVDMCYTMSVERSRIYRVIKEYMMAYKGNDLRYKRRIAPLQAELCRRKALRDGASVEPTTEEA